jgi:cytochrome c7-like protein
MKLCLVLAALVATTLAVAGAPEYPHGTYTADCSSCHEAERFRPARIDPAWKHPATFALRGAHRSAKCRACHASLDFSRAPVACADCHADVHRGELGTDCADCHSPLNFLDRSVQLARHRRTRFPLVGAHVSQDCESCHEPQPQGALTWVGTPIDCVACHLADYQATTDPPHASTGFSTDCKMCHTPTAWERARFDHAGTQFPITGAHRTLPCSACHASGYAGTPTDCYACHQADYEGTTDPDHRALGFPTDCATCHNTTSFDQASFTQHDTQYFPIYSGVHRGRWSRCSDCHTQPSSFSTFSCFLCHGQAETDGRHQEVSGYVYDSNQCYACHPQGRAE